MTDEDKRALAAIEAVVKIADANFPGLTRIRISTDGTASSASVLVPSLLVDRMIRTFRNEDDEP